MTLHMTDDEIKIRYRDALHKPEQIKILSHLNICNPELICQILGLTPKSLIHEDNDRVFSELDAKGMIDAKVARRCGV